MPRALNATPSPPWMPLWPRVKAAIKQAAMTFQGWGGTLGAGGWSTHPYGWPSVQPGSTTNWDTQAGDLWRNEVVSICLGWIGDNYTQPEFQVCEKEGSVWEPIEDHPLTKLLAKPNPYYGASALWQAVVTSEAVSGNGYLIKGRPDRGWGQPMELWYLPHWQVFPQWDTDGRHFITHYIYRVPGKGDQRLAVEDVIHFRRGLSLSNYRSGEAPLGPLIREICSDNEATTYTIAILGNSGVPNVAISADGPNVIIPEDEAQKLQASFHTKFGGDNRGRAMVCTRAMKVAPLGWSPEQMALDKLPQRAEARLCAALRVPPMVVGLNVGDNQRTYANMGEARQMAYEDCLMPLQARHAETLQSQLLRDMGGDPETQLCRYWYENVRALAEDEDAKSGRAVEQFKAGIITRRQALGMVGREGSDEDEVFFVPTGGQLLPAEHAGAGMLTEQMQQKQEMQQAALEGMQGAAESSGDAAAVHHSAPMNGRGAPAGAAR
jgi:HK97 family phage portal protein